MHNSSIVFYPSRRARDLSVAGAHPSRSRERSPRSDEAGQTADSLAGFRFSGDLEVGNPAKWILALVFAKMIQKHDFQ